MERERERRDKEEVTTDIFNHDVTVVHCTAAVNIIYLLYQ